MTKKDDKNDSYLELDTVALKEMKNKCNLSQYSVLHSKLPSFYITLSYLL